MLSAPRYSGASPNGNGEWAVFTSTNYSFESHEASTTWKILRLATGEISDLEISGSEVSEMVWVGPTDTSVLYVNGTGGDVPGGIGLYVADLKDDPVEG